MIKNKSILIGNIYYMLSYLALNDLLLSTEKGEQRLATFWDSQYMHRLFEKFILEYYKKHFSEYKPFSKQIIWDTNEQGFLPRMQSDVMLSSGDKKLIIDTKFYSKIMQGSDTTHSHNVFQIYAYVKNEDKDSTGLVEGMLLYAKTDEEIEPKLHVKTGGNKIHMNVLDLNKNFDDIKIHLNEIIKDWIGENKR